MINGYLVKNSEKNIVAVVLRESQLKSYPDCTIEPIKIDDTIIATDGTPLSLDFIRGSLYDVANEIGTHKSRVKDTVLSDTVYKLLDIWNNILTNKEV